MTDRPPPAVMFDHVSKSFGPKQVLNDVSLSVHAGEALCILGRSGTGKSVTLKLIISLLKPDTGKIWIEQDEVTQLHGAELSRIRRKMGLLFQDAALFDSLTLYENLALPLERLTHKTPAEADFMVDRVLSQVGLAGDKSKMPSELSGGMRKRAGLARALVLEPRILLADEPSSGLDRITASEIDELLLARKAEHSTTLIIVTHDVHGARRVADRVAVLDQGKLVAHGTVAEVERSENDVFVVSQSVRFDSHMICPVQPVAPATPLRLAEGGLRVFFRKREIFGAVGKWESRCCCGISKGRWGRWETGLWFSTVSTVPPFPRLSGVLLGWAWRGSPAGV